MYQIDNSTAATTQPAATAAGTAGFFTDGNPATSTPATIVPAEWLNAVMLELKNVVTGAGLALSKPTYNQVLSAIQAFVQAGKMTVGTDAGAANACVVSYSPAIAALTDGMVLWFKVAVTNTGAATLNVNGLGAIQIWGMNNAPLTGGELVAAGRALVVFRADTNVFSLIECTGGAQPVAPAVSSQHAAQYGQLIGKNRVINGRFRTNQGGYVSGTALAVGAYGFDMWKSSTANSTMTFTAVPQGQQVTIVGSFQEVIEQTNIEAGTYTLSWAGTAQGRVYNSGASAPAYAASPLTVTLDGTQNVIIEFNAGTLDLVQLEAGSIKTTFERVDAALELMRCMRYFQTDTFHCLGAPVAAGTGSTTIVANQSAVQGQRPLAVPMRAAPTFTFKDLVGNASAYSVFSNGQLNNQTPSNGGAGTGGSATFVDMDATFAISTVTWCRFVYTLNARL